MSYDYSRLRHTAERLIKRFGQSGTLRRASRTGVGFDPASTTLDYACNVVVNTYGVRAIDGVRVQERDRLVYVSTEGVSIVPDEADQLIIDGKTYAIVEVKPLSPGGTDIYWEVQARG